ncbi:4-aminobutyrate--2-oxoglutarate transaminase [Balneatrix alpica]|uniref:4-aminobutyrate--2-oxoglutarate transaminase n=1 Tax=Balneatrix alpica TaxID=75684 RepID=A0ABV5ZGE5_9GAMM|nr:4-aminobutyrate--2-oxoglutarate transaminase [Balneatrix alpica]
MTTNQELMQRRQAALPKGIGQAFPVFIEKAKGAELWDVEGRRYIDFAGGIAVMNAGHSHPKVVAAVQKQAAEVAHTCFMVTGYESYVAVCERLNQLAPISGAVKSFLVTTGAEAVENAIKVARAYTKRSGVIAFGGGFHGRTLLGMGLTGKVAPYKAGFGPFPAGIFHAAFPTELHGISTEKALASVEKILKFDIDPSDVAAIIIEPVQGEGGFYVAPPELMVGLRKLCDQHGILLIADEIQTGAGRTGTWLAMEQYPVEADLITMAKSMGSGYPVAALIGRAEVMDAANPGGLGGTYAGNPVACAAALATLEVFEEERVLEQGRALGEHLQAKLGELKNRFSSIGEVRGLGAMVAIELFEGGDLNKPAAELTKKLTTLAGEKGLVLLGCGIYANVIRILVPLTAPLALVDEGLAILEQCLSELNA